MGRHGSVIFYLRQPWLLRKALGTGGAARGRSHESAYQVLDQSGVACDQRYLYWSQSQDFFAPPKPEALIAPVDSAAKAKIDEELEYLVVKRTEVGGSRKTASRREDARSVAAEVSNSASPDVIASIGAQRPAEPSAGLQVVT
jgi:hypothetical protein